MTSRRIISGLLAAVIAATAVPLSAGAATVSELKFQAKTETPIKVEQPQAPTPGEDETIKVNQGGLTLIFPKTAELDRDFEQRITGTVKNTSDSTIKFTMSSDEQYEDIYTDFIKDGSRDYPSELAAGDSFTLNLMVFAQDAKRDSYTLPISAVDESRNKIVSCEIGVTMPTVDISKLDIEYLYTDESTLAQTFRITNNTGMTLTGVGSSVYSEEIPVLCDPVFDSLMLYDGWSENITVTPDLSFMASSVPAITTANATLKVSVAGQEKTQDIVFDAKDTINVISSDELVMKQEGNYLAGVEFVKGSSSMKINGKDIFGADFDPVNEKVINDDGSFNIEMSGNYNVPGAAELKVITSMVGEEYTGSVDAIPESGILDSFCGVNANNEIEIFVKMVSSSAQVTRMMMASGVEAEGEGTGNQVLAEHFAVYIRTVVQLAAEEGGFEMPSGKAGWNEFIGNISRENNGLQFFAYFSDALAPALEAQDVIDETGEMIDAIAGIKDIINDPSLSEEKKIRSLAGAVGSFYESYVMDDLPTTDLGKQAWEAVKAKAEEAYDTTVNVFKQIGDTIKQLIDDLFNNDNGSGTGGPGGSGGGSDKDPTIAPGLPTDIIGSQCTNAGKTSTQYNSRYSAFGSGFSLYAEENTTTSARNQHRFFISSRLYKPTGSYSDKKETGFTYYINGDQAGTSQTGGVTEVAITELNADLLVPGTNYIVADYDTFPGHYFVKSDSRFFETIPSGTPFGYIGDLELSSMPDISAKPDYAVYEENIVELGQTDDENEMNYQVTVYNRGSADGFVNVVISSNRVVCYDDYVFVPAFSSTNVKFSAAYSTSPTIRVGLEDSNMLNKEPAEYTNNNSAQETFATRRVPNYRIRINNNKNWSDLSTVSGSILLRDSEHVDMTRVSEPKVLVNGVDVSDRITFDKDPWYSELTIIARNIPLEIGTNTVKLAVDYQVTALKTEEISAEQTIEYHGEEREFEIEFPENFTESNFRVFIDDDRVSVSKQPDGKYILTIDKYDMRRLESGQVVCLTASNSDTLLTTYFVPYKEGEQPQTTVTFTEENNVKLTFVDPNNVMTSIRLINDQIGISFPVNGENEKRAVISVPMGEYDFRIIGYYDELVSEQYVHIVADGDKETTVTLNKPEFANKGTVSFGTLPLTGNVYSSIVFEDEAGVNAPVTYKYAGKPLEVSAGIYTVSIELYNENEEIAYNISGLNVNEGSETKIQLGLEITGKLRADDVTYIAGETIGFDIIDLTDQYGNKVTYFYSSEDVLSGTFTFVDTTDPSKKFTSGADMYSMSYASGELDEQMNGTYDAYLTINSNANVPTIPTKPSKPGSTGGSSGGSSHRPSTDDEPKISTEIEYLNTNQKRTSTLDTAYDNGKKTFKAYFESHAIGLYANLAKKNGTALEYIGSAKIGRDGVAILPYSEATELVIVVSSDDLTSTPEAAPVLTALDAANILKYCVGMTTLDADKMSVYDADKNGVVNSLDASRILKTIVGKA